MYKFLCLKVIKIRKKKARGKPPKSSEQARAIAPAPVMIAPTRCY